MEQTPEDTMGNASSEQLRALSGEQTAESLSNQKDQTSSHNVNHGTLDQPRKPTGASEGNSQNKSTDVCEAIATGPSKPVMDQEGQTTVGRRNSANVDQPSQPVGASEGESHQSSTDLPDTIIIDPHVHTDLEGQVSVDRVGNATAGQLNEPVEASEAHTQQTPAGQSETIIIGSPGKNRDQEGHCTANSMDHSTGTAGQLTQPVETIRADTQQTPINQPGTIIIGTPEKTRDQEGQNSVDMVGHSTAGQLLQPDASAGVRNGKGQPTPTVLPETIIVDSPEKTINLKEQSSLSQDGQPTGTVQASKGESHQTSTDRCEVVSIVPPEQTDCSVKINLVKAGKLDFSRLTDCPVLVQEPTETITATDTQQTRAQSTEFIGDNNTSVAGKEVRNTIEEQIDIVLQVKKEVEANKKETRQNRATKFHENTNLKITKKVFRCSFCGRGLQTNYGLKKHLITIHQIPLPMVKCKICDKFISKSATNIHTNIKHCMTVRLNKCDKGTQEIEKDNVNEKKAQSIESEYEVTLAQAIVKSNPYVKMIDVMSGEAGTLEAKCEKTDQQIDIPGQSKDQSHDKWIQLSVDASPDEQRTKRKSRFTKMEQLPKVYDCDKCGKTLKTSYGLKIHKANIHQTPEKVIKKSVK